MDAILTGYGEEAGVKVNAFFAPDYAGIIQGMRLIKWISPGTATCRQWKRWIAQRPGLRPDGRGGWIARLLERLIVNKDSPINNLNDLLAKRKISPSAMAILTPPLASSSPVIRLRQKQYLRQRLQAHRQRRHETNALAVANKQVDVATNNTKTSTS